MVVLTGCKLPVLVACSSIVLDCMYSAFVQAEADDKLRRWPGEVYRCLPAYAIVWECKL